MAGVYEINYANPGRCVVFSNTEFEDDNLTDLNPGEIDNRNITELFKSLNYEVEVFSNFTSFGMKNLVNQITQLDFLNDSCFICFINSHGYYGNTIFGADGGEVDLFKDFVNPIKKIRSLSSKPKLFIVDACRGNNTFKSTSTPSNENLERNLISKQTELDHLTNVYKESDILIAYATIENYIANMDFRGSYFIRNLCSQISSEKNKDIFRILTEVNFSISNTGKQVSNISSTLRLSFYFYDQTNQTNEIDLNKNKRAVETRTLANGDTYEGEILNGLRDGRGTYYYENGEKYEGDFRFGHMNGKGTCYYKNGNKYEGTFKDDEIEGKGKFYFNNGEIYEGEFLEDMPHGKGIFYIQNGDKYVGEFNGGKISGFGTIYKQNGDKYVGNWKDGLKHGKGVVYYFYGDKLEANWENDKKNGKGVYFVRKKDTYIPIEKYFVNDEEKFGS